MIASGLGWPRAGVLLLGLAAACAVRAGSLEGRAGPYHLELTVTPDPPTVGANTVVVVVSDAARAPVEGATVTVSVGMADMPMPSTPASATAGGSPGSYESSVQLSMAGRWQLDVAVSAPAGEGRRSFRITTGNPVHQVAEGGRRAVWLWLLLMVAAPVLTWLIPKSLLPAERRGMVAGTLLLLAAVFFARAVVQHFRRPGQMGVIEAQAMDMTAMRPPVGVVPVTVETVRAETFRGGVSYTGSVVPYAQQDVYPRLTGLVVDMPVYAGDRVRRGQVLARLDTREVASRANEAVLAHLAAQDAAGAARQEARSARAAEGQASAEYLMAEARIRQMAAEQAAAEAMVRRSRQEQAAADARLRQAEAQVEAAQAGRRTREAMSDESRAMVRAAEAEAGSAGGMVTEASEEGDAARREVAEAERMIEAAEARRERAAAGEAAMRAELPQAEADLAEMQADLTYAERQLDRFAALLRDQAVSQAEYDEQRAMRDQAAARVDQARAMVASTTERIRAEAAMVREAAAEVAAATERRAGAQAMVRAAEARLAQARSGLTGSDAMVAQREAGVRSRAAEEDEAARMVAMREAEVATMQAEVAASEAAVEQARQDSERAKAGLAEMRAERDRAAAMIRERRAMAAAAEQRADEMAGRAGQARAAAFTAETIAGYTEIRATVDGVITERVTSPATLVQPGMLLMRVAQIDQVRVQANVPQADAAEISPGAPVEIAPRKDPDRRDTALVTAVFPSSNPGSRTQIVESVIDNADDAYLPGDFVTLRIAVGEQRGAVLSVAGRAVIQVMRDGGAVIGETQPAVWVVNTTTADGASRTEYYCTMHPEVVTDQPGTCPKCKMDLTARLAPGGAGAPAEAPTEYYCTMHPEVVSDQPGTCPKCKMDLTPRAKSAGGGAGTVRLARVTLGAGNGDRVEVLAGLEPGDQVVVAGHDGLHEGDRVQIVTAAAEPVPTVGGPKSPVADRPSRADSGRDRTPARPAAGVAGDPGGPIPRRAAPPRSGSSGRPRAGRPAPPTEPTSPPPPAPKPAFACPMHPEVTSNQPGATCPKCKMDLEPVAG